MSTKKDCKKFSSKFNYFIINSKFCHQLSTPPLSDPNHPHHLLSKYFILFYLNALK